jgi:hypothetical protein
VATRKLSFRLRGLSNLAEQNFEFGILKLRQRYQRNLDFLCFPSGQFSRSPGFFDC